MKDDPKIRRAGMREVFLAQRGQIESAHPGLFQSNWRARIGTTGFFAALVALYIFGLTTLEMTPVRLFRGVLRLGDFVGLMLPPNPESWARVHLYLSALGETLAIALLGTLLAAILSFPFGFLAAKNILPNSVVHFFTRRSLDTIRSVDTLIWALIWINVVGLGPFAGVLAIMSSDFGAFGKLISEAIETVDGKAVEGIRAAGGSRAAVIRFGVVPQVLPVILSQILYFFESNVRSATIVGIVGAGGIGLHLSEQIRVLEWQQVSFIIILILVTVAIIDLVSQRLRGAIIGDRG